MLNTPPTPLTTWLRCANYHPLRSRLLLSGSTLIAAICPHARLPHDLDYVVTGTYDHEIMTRIITEIAATADAGPQLSLGRIDEIHEYTAAFPGVRVELVVLETGCAPRPLLVDFTFGDPLTVPPRPVIVPTVGSVLAIAPESLCAWKVHALVQFGPYGWRPKDVYDLHVLWTEGRLDLAVLPQAIDVAFSSRNSTLDELDDFLKNEDQGWMNYGVERWNEFATANQVPFTFPAIRTEIRTMLDRLL